MVAEACAGRPAGQTAEQRGEAAEGHDHGRRDQNQVRCQCARGQELEKLYAGEEADDGCGHAHRQRRSRGYPEPSDPVLPPVPGDFRHIAPRRPGGLPRLAEGGAVQQQGQHDTVAHDEAGAENLQWSRQFHRKGGNHERSEQVAGTPQE